jgi:hypothetical protein
MSRETDFFAKCQPRDKAPNLQTEGIILWYSMGTGQRWNYDLKKKVKVSTYPRNRPWRLIGLWDVKDPTLSRPALSNAAPAGAFSGALRKHIIWADY